MSVEESHRHTAVASERTELLPESARTKHLTSLFADPSPPTRFGADGVTASVVADGNANQLHQNDVVDESLPTQEEGTTLYGTLGHRCSISTIISTATGSVIFLIYQVVFCLAQAATISRPSSMHTTAGTSMGVMARTAALGSIIAGPVFIWELGSQIPAIYPASDLFLAPFLAKLADEIDQVLSTPETALEANYNDVFLATFLAVSGLGMLLSGVLCVLASRFKLANLGAFLPYPVLCGFFTTIGILMWTLGFSVDTGMKIEQIVASRDINVIRNALLHHAPSILVGVGMHIAGRHHPYWVMFGVIMTILVSYVVLWSTDTSLREAQAAKWFFSADDLRSSSGDTSIKSSLLSYGPPLPFGLFAAIWRGEVRWDAAKAGLSPILALAFLYVIRCSLHSAALKKNIGQVTRKVDGAKSSSTKDVRISHKKRKEMQSLGYILERGYAHAQFVAAAVGGIAVAPSVAASLTMFQLGAERSPPQYGSCILLVIFYVTDFSLAQYVPKPAFSCLMVLAGLDMCRKWTYESFFKTKDKLEWAVCPVLVIMAFWVGLLNAIFLGIAISTFVFAANFYNAGTVKFVGSGLTLRSTVERGPQEWAWLDQKSDLTQILVLQNYIFFGNAQSILNYVGTMFEEEDENDSNGSVEIPDIGSLPLPPIPKYLIIDFNMVSGMDTAAIDLFRDIVALCADHDCKLFLSGLNVNLQSMLTFAGIERKDRTTSFILDLETALARAEDGLLSNVIHVEELITSESERRERLMSIDRGLVEEGFVYALRKIDEQHGLSVTPLLESLSTLATLIELEPNEVLPRDPRNPGIYFVETGILKLRHASGINTTTTSAAGSSFSSMQWQRHDSTVSIGHMDARRNNGGPLSARRASSATETNATTAPRRLQADHHPTFRLARIGQGWVIGNLDASSNESYQGLFVSVTRSRLHFLPVASVKELEVIKPCLAMHLYKLMSVLASKRQDATIQQLDQFIKILNAPTPRLRGGKRELVKLQHY